MRATFTRLGAIVAAGAQSTWREVFLGARWPAETYYLYLSGGALPDFIGEIAFDPQPDGRIATARLCEEPIELYLRDDAAATVEAHCEREGWVRPVGPLHEMLGALTRIGLSIPQLAVLEELGVPWEPNCPLRLCAAEETLGVYCGDTLADFTLNLRWPQEGFPFCVELGGRRIQLCRFDVRDRLPGGWLLFGHGDGGNSSFLSLHETDGGVWVTDHESLPDPDAPATGHIDALLEGLSRPEPAG